MKEYSDDLLHKVIIQGTELNVIKESIIYPSEEYDRFYNNMEKLILFIMKELED